MTSSISSGRLSPALPNGEIELKEKSPQSSVEKAAQKTLSSASTNTSGSSLEGRSVELFEEESIDAASSSQIKKLTRPPTEKFFKKKGKASQEEVSASSSSSSVGGSSTPSSKKSFFKNFFSKGKNPEREETSTERLERLEKQAAKAAKAEKKAAKAEKKAEKAEKKAEKEAAEIDKQLREIAEDDTRLALKRAEKKKKEFEEEQRKETLPPSHSIEIPAKREEKSEMDVIEREAFFNNRLERLEKSNEKIASLKAEGKTEEARGLALEAKKDAKEAIRKLGKQAEILVKNPEDIPFFDEKARDRLRHAVHKLFTKSLDDTQFSPSVKESARKLTTDYSKMYKESKYDEAMQQSQEFTRYTLLKMYL